MLLKSTLFQWSFTGKKAQWHDEWVPLGDDNSTLRGVKNVIWTAYCHPGNDLAGTFWILDKTLVLHHAYRKILTCTLMDIKSATIEHFLYWRSKKDGYF